MITLIKIKLKRKIKIISACIFCLIPAAFILKYPTLSADGIRNGLEICGKTMIPSLFPFLVISAFATSSGILEIMGRKTEKICRKILKLSGTAGSVIFFGLWGGFPVGCSMAQTLLSQNKITQNEAKRIVLSSVNAGPAFVIGAVGTMFLSSFKAGVIMYVSLSLASLTISFLSRFILEDTTKKQINGAAPSPLSEAFVTSVYSASQSMISICAWLVVFSCFLAIATGKTSGENTSSFLKAVCEVSLGCSEISRFRNPVILSAIIGWGGLCVHCQVLPNVIKTGLKLKYFFCSRLLHSMLASIICSLLIKIFPCEISVFSSGTETIAQTFAVSAPAATGLLIMCAIFILDLDTHKKMC